MERSHDRLLWFHIPRLFAVSVHFKQINSVRFSLIDFQIGQFQQLIIAVNPEVLAYLANIDVDSASETFRTIFSLFTLFFRFSLKVLQSTIRFIDLFLSVCPKSVNAICWPHRFTRCSTRICPLWKCNIINWALIVKKFATGLVTCDRSFRVWSSHHICFKWINCVQWLNLLSCLILQSILLT